MADRPATPPPAPPVWDIYTTTGSIEGYDGQSTMRGERLGDAAARRPDSTKIPLPIWCFLQQADLDMLGPSGTTWEAKYLDYSADSSAPLEHELSDLVYVWSQSSKPSAISRTPSKKSSSSVTHSRTRSGQAIGGTEASTGRSASVAYQARLRDGDRCVITGSWPTEVAHISPWCAFGQNHPHRIENFWKCLRMFFTEEKVNAWHNQLFVDPRRPHEATETVKNMITLGVQAHALQKKGTFALRPVRMSQDKTQLELEFHWLARRERKVTEMMDLLDTPEPTRDRTYSMSDAEQMFRVTPPGVGEFIKSGRRFVMTTDDPVRRPLPDQGLLELQWHLQRVLSMMGGAEWLDSDYERDSDGRVDPLLALDQRSETVRSADNDLGLGGATDTAVDVQRWLENVPGDADPAETQTSSPDESVQDGL
jgi:HNH endonuclease